MSPPSIRTVPGEGLRRGFGSRPQSQGGSLCPDPRPPERQASPAPRPHSPLATLWQPRPGCWESRRRSSLTHGPEMQRSGHRSAQRRAAWGSEGLSDTHVLVPRPRPQDRVSGGRCLRARGNPPAPGLRPCPPASAVPAASETGAPSRDRRAPRRPCPARGPARPTTARRPRRRRVSPRREGRVASASRVAVATTSPRGAEAHGGPGRRGPVGRGRNLGARRADAGGGGAGRSRLTTRVGKLLGDRQLSPPIAGTWPRAPPAPASVDGWLPAHPRGRTRGSCPRARGFRARLAPRFPSPWPPARPRSPRRRY